MRSSLSRPASRWSPAPHPASRPRAPADTTARPAIVILRLDADCIPGREWIERMLDAFAQHPDAGAMTGGADFADGPRCRSTRARVAVSRRVLRGHLRRRSGILPSSDRTSGCAERHGRMRPPPSIATDPTSTTTSTWRSTSASGTGSASHGTCPWRCRSGRCGACHPSGERVARGFRTVFLHWPADFPPKRWRRLWSIRRAGRQPFGEMRKPFRPGSAGRRRRSM